MRFIGRWGRPPELNDVAFQTSVEGVDDADVVRRAYRVVGVEEGRDAEHYRLVVERVDFDEALDAGPFGEANWWTFYNLPRR